MNVGKESENRRGERLTEVEDHVEPSRPSGGGPLFRLDDASMARLSAEEPEDVFMVERFVDPHFAYELFRLLLHSGRQFCRLGVTGACLRCCWVQRDDFEGCEVVRGVVEGAVDDGLPSLREVLSGHIAKERRERRHSHRHLSGPY